MSKQRDVVKNPMADTQQTQITSMKAGKEEEEKATNRKQVIRW